MTVGDKRLGGGVEPPTPPLGWTANSCFKDPDFGEFGGRLLIYIFQNLKILGALINFDFLRNGGGRLLILIFESKPQKNRLRRTL